MSPNTCVVLHDDGIGLVLDLTDGHLPAVVHWGADIGDPTAEDAAALMRAGTVPTVRNGIDAPMRLALLPEHWTGWVGRPGISASLAGGQRSVTHSAPVVDLSPALNARAGSGRAAKRHE